jgi:signal transduction histidine kinase
LYAPEARERGVGFSLDATGVAIIMGQRQLLAQLCVNLLENVLKYVPPGGRVELFVRRESDQIVLGVSDNGPGIPESQRVSMLLPFRRLERDAIVPGSGLGLSLVAAVVRLHGGTLKLCENGPGLLVRCSFPAR